MSDTRHSEALVWGCIGVCGIASFLAQFTHAVGVRPALDETFTVMESPPDRPAAETAAPPEPWALDAADPGPQPARLFVDAVVQVESAGDPRCVGKSGERGLMQIKAGTWREMTVRLYAEPIDFARAFEPGLNRTVGQAYLAYLEAFLRDHRGAWRNDLRTLLAASYNAGPTRMREANFDVRRLSPHTQDYARRVTALHDHYLVNPPVVTPTAEATAYALAETSPRAR